MARVRIGTPRQAISSYQDDIRGFWDDFVKPTTPWTADEDPVFTFVGINVREALSTLNRRFYEFLTIIQGQATATSPRNFVNQCLDTLPVVPGPAAPGPGVFLPSMGAGNHGIRFIPATAYGPWPGALAGLLRGTWSIDLVKAAVQDVEAAVAPPPRPPPLRLPR